MMDLTKINALIIDDNRADQFLLTDHLLTIGFEESRITTYEDIPDQESNSFDLVLCDLNLTNTKGLKTIEKVTSVYPDSTIITLTGYTDLDIASLAIQGGIQDYLIKGEIASADLKKSISFSLERTLLKQKLLKVKDEYELFFESSPNPLLICDQSTGSILKVNRKAETVYGYSFEEFSKLTFSDLSLSGQKDSFDKLIRMNMGTFTHKTKAKNSIIVEASATKVWDVSDHHILVSVYDITDKVMMEKKLSLNSKRYEYAVKAASDVIYDWDLETNEVFWGNTLEKILGYVATNKFNISTWIGCIDPMDRLNFLAVLDEIISGTDQKDEWQKEYRIKKKDNSYINVVDKAVIIRNEDNKPIRIIGAIEDITERSIAERELKKSNEKYSLLFHKSPFIMFIIDTEDTTIVNINDATASQTGLHRDKLINTRFLSHLNGESVKHFEAKLGDYDQSASIEFGLCDFIPEGGKVMNLEITGVPIIIDEKQRLFLSCMDVTDKLEAERALQQSNEMYKHVVKATNDAIWDWDIKNEKLHFADNYERVFGHKASSSDVNYERWEKNIHPEDKEVVINSLERALGSTDHRWKREYRFKKANGHFANVEDVGEIIRDASGEAVRMVGALKDITIQKDLEVTLERANELSRLGNWELNLENNRLFWSNITKEIHGVPKDFEPDLESAIEFYKDNESRIKLESSISKAMSGDIDSWNIEAQVMRPDGTEIWVRAIGQVVRVNGKVIKLYGSFQDINEKKTRETALNEINLRYKLAIQSTSLGVWDWHVKDDILTWDEGMKQLYKADPNEFPSSIELWEHVIHPEDCQHFLRQLKKTRCERRNLDATFRIVGPDNTYNYVRCYAQAITGNEGVVSRIVGVSYDITDEVVQQQALEKALFEKNRILESIDDGFFTVDTEWTVIQWNRAAEGMLEMPRNMIVGKNLWEVYSDIVPLSFYRKYHLAVKGQKPVFFEEYYPGKKLWLHCSAYPNENGLSVFFKDITQQKMHQEEILEKSIRSMEKERNRIAQELHDGVLQEMVGSMMIAERICKLLPQGDKETSLANDLVYFLKKATNDTRRISHDLRSPEIEGTSLFTLIEKLVDQLNLLYEIEFSFVLEKSIQNLAFTDSYKTNIYRVVQELITNTIKHANASRVMIQARKKHSILILSVEDNGLGFDPESARVTNGIGMRNINDRLDFIGAKINFTSTLNKGSKCIISLKIENS